MYRRTTTVINRTGLHARPASQFTNAAKAFDSRISIRNLSLKEQDNIANAKSIISVLTLALVQGSEVDVYKRQRHIQRYHHRTYRQIGVL